MLLRLIRVSHPDNLEARLMLQDEETYWLEQILAKIDREQQASVADLEQYFQNRNFGASPFWGMSLTTVLADTEGPADRVGEIEALAVADQAALMMVIQLVKAGMPLSELPGITPELLEETLPLERAVVAGVDPAITAKQVADDINRAFDKLPQLTPLSSTNYEGCGVPRDTPITDLGQRSECRFVEEVNGLFEEDLYLPLDPELSSLEWVLDFVKPKNVIPWLTPYAVVRVGSVWQITRTFGIVKIGSTWRTTSSLSAAELAAARGAGEVVRSYDALAAGMGLRGFANTLMASRFGPSAQAALVGWEGQHTLTKLLNLLVLQFAASHLAQESGIPGAQLLVELIFEAGESELLYRALYRTAVPVRKLTNPVTGYRRHLEGRGAVIRYRRPLNTELRSVRQGASGRTSPSGGSLEQRLRTVARQIPPGAERTIPHSLDEGADHAWAAAATALDPCLSPQRQRLCNPREVARALDAAEKLDRLALEAVEDWAPKAAIAERRLLQLSDESSSVIRRAKAALNRSSIPVWKILEAHRVGRPPYTSSDLRRKVLILTSAPPAGAGLTRVEAEILMREGITGFSTPALSNRLSRADRTLYNRLRRREPSSLSPDDLDKLQRLRREALWADNLTAEQRERFRREIRNPPPGKTADDVRYQRYEQRTKNEGRLPGNVYSRADWQDATNRINANREVGTAQETAGRNGLRKHLDRDLSNNNLGDDIVQETVVDQKTQLDVTTRPDSVGRNNRGEIDVIHDHKDKSGSDPVVYDDAQLRAQRQLVEALDGQHFVTVSSSSPQLSARPPTPRPSVPLAGKSKVYYTIDEKVTHMSGS